MGTVEAAQAIVQIAISKMSLAVREVSVEKGYDPRDFALVASGGAGPLHVCAIARELHIPKVIVPLFPSHFSALGMLLADERHDFIRTFYCDLASLDFAALDPRARRDGGGGEEKPAPRRQRRIPDRARPALCRPGIHAVGAGVARRCSSAATGRRSARRSMRSISIATPTIRPTSRWRWSISASPASASGRSWRSRNLPAKPPPSRNAATSISTTRTSQCRARSTSAAISAPARASPGPALIEEHGTTTVLFKGDTLRVARSGELLIDVGGA